MTGEVDFEPVGPSPESSDGDLARKEQKLFGEPKKPNTVVVPLWKGGHLSFNPDSHVPIFAIVALVILVSLAVICSLIGIFASPEAVWMERLFTAIGHAITGIVGAIVGSSIPRKDK